MGQKKKARRRTICTWVRVVDFPSGGKIERRYRNRMSNYFLSIDIDFFFSPNDQQIYYIHIMIRPINKPLGVISSVHYSRLIATLFIIKTWYSSEYIFNFSFYGRDYLLSKISNDKIKNYKFSRFFFKQTFRSFVKKR